MSVPVPERIASRIREADYELLFGLAEGLPFNVIGEKINQSEVQVSNRVYWLRCRIFKARTNAQLVAMSYHYGILKAPYYEQPRQIAQ